MTKELALITVIIPTYKRPVTLARAIKSALYQNRIKPSKIEIIVVDDNNAGDKYRIETESVMCRFVKNKSIKYIQHTKNRNGSAARNTGLKAANGKYITFLDDDDIFMPDRVRKLVDILETESKYGAIYSGYAYVRNEHVVRVPKLPHPKDEIYDLLCQKSFFGTGSNFICRTDNARSIGGFDEQFERHQDMEFMIRFLEKFSVTYLDQVLVAKCVDSTINIPNAKKMERVKKLFLKEFKGLIDSYDVMHQNAIYRANYLEFARVVAWNNTRPSAWMGQKIAQYGGLTLRDKTVIVLKKAQSKSPLFDDVRYYFAKKCFGLEERKVASLVSSIFLKLKDNDG